MACTKGFEVKEVTAWERVVHGILERIVGRDVRYVRPVCRTSASRELANQTAIPAHYERARVAVVGELSSVSPHHVVAADDKLERPLCGTVLGLLAIY